MLRVSGLTVYCNQPSLFLFAKNQSTSKQVSKMAMSQAALKAEQAIGHGDNATTAQDVTNPANDREKYGDTSVSMKALVWMGKNDVQMSKSACANT